MCQSLKGSDSVLFKPVQLRGKIPFFPLTIMPTAAQGTSRTGPRRYKAAEEGSRQELLSPCIPSPKIASHLGFHSLFSGKHLLKGSSMPTEVNRVS